MSEELAERCALLLDKWQSAALAAEADGYSAEAQAYIVCCADLRAKLGGKYAKEAWSQRVCDGSSAPAGVEGTGGSGSEGALSGGPTQDAPDQRLDDPSGAESAGGEGEGQLEESPEPVL